MGFDTKPNLNSCKFEQCTDDIMNLSGCTQIFGTFDLESGSTMCTCVGSTMIVSGEIQALSLSGKTDENKVVYLKNDGTFISGTTASDLKVYYVDANNSTDGEGTVTNPYKTIDSAVDAVIGNGSHASPENEGMTVFVQGGTYTTDYNLAITCTSWSFEGGSCVTYTGTDYLFQGTGMSSASGVNFLNVSGKGEFFTATGGIISAIGTDTTQGAGQIRRICFEANRIYSTYENYSNPLAKPIIYVAGGTSASGWNSLSTGLVLKVDYVAGYSQTPFHSDHHAYFNVCDTGFGLGSSTKSALSTDGRLIDIDGLYAGTFKNVTLSAYDVDYMVELGISGTTLEAASLRLCNVSYTTTRAVGGRRPDKFMAISPLALDTNQSHAPDISEFVLANISGHGTWFTNCTQSIDYNGNPTYPELETLRFQNVETPYGIDECIKPNVCNQVYGLDTCIYSGGTYNIIGERFTLSNIRDCSGGENQLYITPSGEVKQGTGSGSIVGSSENVTKEITQATHGFALNDFIGWSGGTYNKAVADGLYDGEFVGVISCVPDGNTFNVTQSGYVEGLTASFAADTTYWLSESTAGLLTSTEPSTDGEISKPAFVADTTSSGWVLPYPGVVITSGASVISTADNGLTDNGGIVELGGTLCQHTDIDVSGYNLSISGLSGKTTQDKVLYIDDATGTLVTGATSSGIYDGQSPAAIEVGGIGVGTELTGKTYTDLFEELLVPELYQTSVGTPSTSMGLTYNSIQEIGDTLNQTLTPTYTAGAITPLYETDNGTTRGGASNNYNYSGPSVSTGWNGQSSCNLPTYTVTSGVQTWTVCTRYDEGACVRGSKGTVNPTYPTVCAQDTITPAGSASINGILPWYWGTKASGTITAADVTGGTRTLAVVGASTPITFNAVTEYLWFAAPAGTYTTKTKWWVCAANAGIIGGTGELWAASCSVNVSCGSMWSGCGFDVYVSCGITTTAAGIPMCLYY